MQNRKVAIRAVIGLLLLSSGTYVTLAAIRAHRNLVTLNVRDMEVRKVISKIEWQTRETIIPDKNVKGKVTMNVRNVPLETALHIIGEQTESRFSTVYPLYSSSRSMSMLQRTLRGEVEAEFAGWTNLHRRGFGGFSGGRGPGGPGGGPGGRGGGGFFGEPSTNRNSVISLDIHDKDVQFAATALSRFGGVRVVPDDKLHKTVTLKVDQVPVEKAISRLASTAGAKWDRIYSLRGDEGPRQFADRRGGFRDLTDAEREEMRRQRQEAEEEMMQTISAEERAKLEEARKERERMFQEMQSLTPEQRRDRFQQMGSNMRDQRTMDRIKNTTPQQRVDRYREMNERRKQWQANGGQGGPGQGRGGRGPGGRGGPGGQGGASGQQATTGGPGGAPPPPAPAAPK
ncbi:MAG TPA: hypothetical protein VJ063_06260 [Verrucomicrobiae bacterium]|nr:hypothetical protein [Verrucomicrobiae bacterium]